MRVLEWKLETCHIGCKFKKRVQWYELLYAAAIGPGPQLVLISVLYPSGHVFLIVHQATI